MLLSQGCSAQTNLYLIALMGQSKMERRGELTELPAGFPANPTRFWNFYQCLPRSHRFARRPSGRRFHRQVRWSRAVTGARRRLRVGSSRNVGWVDSVRETKISKWLKTQKPATGGARYIFVHEPYENGLSCQ